MNNYLNAINDVADDAMHYNEDVLNALMSRWETILDDEESKMLFI